MTSLQGIDKNTDYFIHCIPWHTIMFHIIFYTFSILLLTDWWRSSSCRCYKRKTSCWKIQSSGIPDYKIFPVSYEYLNSHLSPIRVVDNGVSSMFHLWLSNLKFGKKTNEENCWKPLLLYKYECYLMIKHLHEWKSYVTKNLLIEDRLIIFLKLKYSKDFAPIWFFIAIMTFIYRYELI